MHLPLLLAVTIYGQTSGGLTIQCITNPPVSLNVITNERTVTSGSLTTNVLKDRIYRQNSTASSVTDYQLSVSRAATYLLSNPLVSTIDTNGAAYYTNSGNTFALASTDYGTFVAMLFYSSNSAVTTSNFLGFVSTSLASNLQFSIQNLYTGRGSSAWGYNPSASDLGTNTTVWTDPPLLPCVGITSVGYQTTLIAPNITLWNNHYFGAWTNSISGVPTTATFTGTNGTKYTARYTNAISGPNDFAIAILESNMSVAVVPANVLFPTVSNNISSWLGVQTFWAHKNTTHVDLANTVVYPASIFNGNPGMILFNARTNIFGNEQGATGGDSGSPAFVVFGTTNIAMFAATQSGDVAGDPVFDPVYWTFLSANVNTNNLNVFPLSGFPTY